MTKDRETDYLVVGGGALAMAFVDAMLPETDATFTIVDRRHAPGGHWNDAYPFVRLHQPSSFYGVASRPLGRDRVDTEGFNKGLYELASGIEVAAYFHAVMAEDFLPSGRVCYHPMSEHVGGGEIVSLLSGARQRVRVRKKLVDATMLQTSVPLTHTRSFTVAEGVTCAPPNDLPRLAPRHDRFTVLGGGKTALDVLLWLRANGAPPEAIAWVAPRDQWLWNRAVTQPGMENFERSFGALAAQYEILAAASSVEDICEGMERTGQWLRIDPGVRPSMLHGATVSEAECAALRTIGNVIRKGRVQHIECDKIVLDQGDTPAAANTLYVDCTARALAANVGSRTPVFGDGIISLQMVRTFQPTFSAALIGRIEATIPDDAEKRAMTHVAPMADTVEDWLRIQLASMTNQAAWSGNSAIDAWITACRLNGFGSLAAQVGPDDAAKRAILGRVRASAGPAARTLAKLSAAATGFR